jgi:RHS repeat-associated protein
MIIRSVIFETYNVIHQNGVKRDRTHNAANELQNIAAHDANGNMTLMPTLKGKYDAWNRLVEARNTNDVLIAQYEYNALNQRIKKTVGATITQSFFNENWQELESVTNNQVTTYVWGLRYVDDLVLREKGSEKLYSIADPNWNVVAICDNTGDIQEHYSYNAFGKRNVLNNIFVAQIESAFNWNRAFTGQVLDSETGLMLYRHRFYHVELGRFVNRDPIGYDAGDENLYRYISNQTASSFDTYGLQMPMYPDVYPELNMYPIQQEYQNGTCEQNYRPVPREQNKIKAASHSCTVDCKKRCKGIIGHARQGCLSKCKSYEKRFNDWYNKNRDITWTNDLLRCPCKLKDRCLDDWSEPGYPVGGYHVGATNCIRTKHKAETWNAHGNQCCYDANGDLITSGSGQGSSDWQEGGIYGVLWGTHLSQDMWPADWAKFLDGGGWGCYSEAYLNVRPQVKAEACKGVPTPEKK